MRYHSRESERRTAALFYLSLDREVSNLGNEVGPVWRYVLRITPDTSDNTAHTVDDLFVLRWIRVCVVWSALWDVGHEHERERKPCPQPALAILISKLIPLMMQVSSIAQCVLKDYLFVITNAPLGACVISSVGAVEMYRGQNVRF